MNHTGGKDKKRGNKQQKREMRADREAGGWGSGSLYKATVVLQHAGSFNVKEGQIELDRIKLADFLRLSQAHYD